MIKKVILILTFLLTTLTCYSYNESPNVILEPCPICNTNNFLHYEYHNGLWTIRCENPSHYPQFLVMASSETECNLIKIWNHRGNEEKK